MKTTGVSDRERTRAGYVLLLLLYMYFLTAVLTGSPCPFEGAWVPQIRGISTPNLGSTRPKPSCERPEPVAVVLMGSSCPFSVTTPLQALRARPGYSPMLSLLLCAGGHRVGRVEALSSSHHGIING